jgi:hypothetical protein
VLPTGIGTPTYPHLLAQIVTPMLRLTMVQLTSALACANLTTTVQATPALLALLTLPHLLDLLPKVLADAMLTSGERPELVLRTTARPVKMVLPSLPKQLGALSRLLACALPTLLPRMEKMPVVDAPLALAALYRMLALLPLLLACALPTFTV